MSPADRAADADLDRPADWQCPRCKVWVPLTERLVRAIADGDVTPLCAACRPAGECGGGERCG